MALAKPQSKFSTALAQACGTGDSKIYLNDTLAEGIGYLIIERGTSNEEIIKYVSVGSGYVSACTRRLSTVGTAETAGTGLSHNVGAQVEMTDTHFYFAREIDAINGVSSTSANNFIIGIGSASLSSQGNTLFKAQTSAGAQFQIGLSTNGFGIWSDDNGVSYNRLSATGGAVNTGDGWQNTGGTGSVYVADLISATGGISSKSDNFMVNEAWSPTWTGDHTFTGTNVDISATNFKIKGTKVSCQASELNSLVNGVSAYATDTAYNVSLVTGGSETNLHYHYFIAGLSSRDKSSTGTQDISFTSALTPKLFKVTLTGATGEKCIGFATSATTMGCTFQGVNTGAARTNSTAIIMLQDSVSYAYVSATVSVMSAGRITLNWPGNTSTGGNSDNLRGYMYEIFG